MTGAEWGGGGGARRFSLLFIFLGGDWKGGGGRFPASLWFASNILTSGPES